MSETKCETIITMQDPFPTVCKELCTFNVDRDLEITDEQKAALKIELDTDPVVAARYATKALKSVACKSCSIDYYNHLFRNTLPLPATIYDPIPDDVCHIGMVISTMVLLYDYPFLLPGDVYYICGETAYKWLPTNSEGLCYLGRLVPQFYTITHNQLKKVMSQPSKRYKRDETEVINKIDKKMVPLIHKSVGHRVGISFGNVYTWGNMGFMTNQNDIERLASFIDNITEIYDTTFRYVGHELQGFKNELLQHRFVLDYLTAQTGGYCLTLETELGLHCCSYITNDTSNPEVIINEYMDEARDLKQNFRTQNYDKDSKNDSWWSWLDPSTWFSGLGTFLSNILYSCLKFIFIILVVILSIYACYKIGLCCIQKITHLSTAKTNFVQVTPAETVMLTEIYTPV